jgi:hypothetical protein
MIGWTPKSKRSDGISSVLLPKTKLALLTKSTDASGVNMGTSWSDVVIFAIGVLTMLGYVGISTWEENREKQREHELEIAKIQARKK